MTPKDPIVGWLVAVVVDDGEGGPGRRYFAVGKPDQQRAEWAAVDQALTLGRVATSPVGGMEPVEALAPLQNSLARRMGLADGMVKALGSRWPRRWLLTGA